MAAQGPLSVAPLGWVEHVRRNETEGLELRYSLSWRAPVRSTPHLEVRLGCWDCVLKITAPRRLPKLKPVLPPIPEVDEKEEDEESEEEARFQAQAIVKITAVYHPTAS